MQINGIIMKISEVATNTNEIAMTTNGMTTHEINNELAIEINHSNAYQ